MHVQERWAVLKDGYITLHVLFTSIILGLRNEMPEEPRPKALWILNRLSADLQSARMWPVRLAHLKHQESLCNLIQVILQCRPNREKYRILSSAIAYAYFGFPMSVFQP